MMIMSDYGKAAAYPLSTSAEPGHRFAFRPRGGRINWRYIDSLNVEEIKQHGDVKKLETCIENMAFARLDPDRDEDKDLYKHS